MKKEIKTLNNFAYYNSKEGRFIETNENMTAEIYKDGVVEGKYIDADIEGIEIFYYPNTTLEVNYLHDCKEILIYLNYDKNNSVYLIKLPFNENIKVEAYPEGLKTDDVAISDGENVYLYIEVPYGISVIYKIKYDFISEDKINGIYYDELFYVEMKLSVGNLFIDKLSKGFYKILDSNKKIYYNKLKIRN